MLDALLQNSSFYLNYTDMVLALVLSAAQGFLVCFVYRYSYRGVLYTKNFSISLVLMAVISSVLIMAVATNIVLSLGMVGALSIVRFRTALKDPLDIVFLFWAISIGIVTGAGLFFLSLFGSICVALIILLMTRLSFATRPYMLSIHCSPDVGENEIREVLKKNSSRFHLKAKNKTANHCELTFELRIKDGSDTIVNRISEIEGVTHAVLIVYNGDYVS